MTPEKILEEILNRATSANFTPLDCDEDTRNKIDFVVTECTSNRAGVRLLMACLLVKTHTLEKDITKPYTEIGG